MDDADPVRSDAHATRPEHRRTRSTRIATGTLACPRCDAPVALAGPVSPAEQIGCPFCSHAGRVHEFLSLEPPSRPARVEVTVRLPAPRRAPIQI
jgi:uncharacterized paraquat-inducible protein A